MIVERGRIAYRPLVLTLVIAIVGTACSGSDESEQADVGDGAVAAGEVAPGYRGPAYPVPLGGETGPHVNDVQLELMGTGSTSGDAVFAHAGDRLLVRPHGDDPDRVEVQVEEGVWALGDRNEFWVVPAFATLGDLEFTIGGDQVQLEELDLAYHLGSLEAFDDPETDEYDAITFPVRLFLSCFFDEWAIANQKFAGDVLAAGVFAGDDKQIEAGARALDWGVEQEVSDDGVFLLDRDCDDEGPVRDVGESHHTTQWLESVGRAVYVMAASEYAGEFRPRIDRYVEHMEMLADRLFDDEVFSHWRDSWAQDRNGDPFTSKFFMRGAAMALAASLTDDDDDRSRWLLDAKQNTEEGMGFVTEEGVAPQRGGHDVRYQMSSAYLGAVHYSLLAEGELKDSLRASIDEMISWMATRVDAETGVVDPAGSTRTCTATDGDAPFEPYLALYALLIWGHMEKGRGDVLDLALLIDRGHKQTGNSCP